MSVRTSILAAFLLVAGCACEEEAPKPKPAAATPAKPSVALPAPVASGLPGDPTRVSSVVNPKQEKAYEGPTATLRGIVRASGDPASAAVQPVDKIPADCEKAREFYGPPFREGPQRELADVLVTVTGYQGYVPETEPVVTLQAKDCNWGTQTIALTFGQRLEVVSRDKNTYVPELLGAKMQSQLLATPFGKGTAQLYPPAVGRYVLVDNLKLFMTAEVLVLKYPTHAVTGTDGRYKISGIPPGKVKVNALLPSTGATLEKEIVLKGDEITDLELTLPFDAKQYEAFVKSAGKASINTPAPAASR